MKRKLAVLALTTALIAGFLISRSDPKADLQGATLASPPASPGETEKSTFATPAVAQSAPAKVLEKPVMAPALGEMAIEKLSNELTAYAKIRSKVFPSVVDQTARARDLQDAKLILSSQQYLGSVRAVLPGAPESSRLTTDAIDFLLDARAAGSPDAEAALRSLVQDAQVEDQTLDSGQRKALAGVKGDILYYWSSQQPARNSELVSWLPGPVSHKIWQNVIGAQNQNLSEAQTLKN